jgi:hypothetical protein
MPRIIVLVVISKWRSWQEGSGQGHFNISRELRPNVLGNSLDKLSFLLQGFLQA